MPIWDQLTLTLSQSRFPRGETVKLTTGQKLVQAWHKKQQKVAGLRIRLSSGSRQIGFKTPPVPHMLFIPPTSGAQVAPEGSSTSPPCVSAPSPPHTPDSGNGDVWADTMEVLLMYFLSLFPQRSSLSVHVCVNVCVREGMWFLRKHNSVTYKNT